MTLDKNFAVHVLLVEDNPADAELAKRAIARGAQTQYTIECCDHMPEALSLASHQSV